MAKTKHTFRTNIAVLINGNEIAADEMVIEFTYQPGAPATYYDQGYGPEISIERVSAFAAKTLKPLELPQWIVESLDDNDSLHFELADYAEGEIEHQRDEAADFRRREARDEQARA